MFLINIVCNIPHSGTTIPKWALEDFLIPKDEIKEFTKRMVDVGVDQLFSFVNHDSKVISRISRVVVDMERFRDDSRESMAALGMGLFYEKDDTGNIIRARGGTYERCLAVYDKYHRKLERTIEYQLQSGRVLILDCHSFHDDMTFTKYSQSEFPDVCIGVNDDRTKDMASIITEEAGKRGLSVAINIPFAEALLPEKFENNPNVGSIMIELNRRIYMSSENAFSDTWQMCFDIVRRLRESYFS